VTSNQVREKLRQEQKPYIAQSLVLQTTGVIGHGGGAGTVRTTFQANNLTTNISTDFKVQNIPSSLDTYSAVQEIQFLWMPQVHHRHYVISPLH
jgi:hypothetical protein